MVRKRPRVRIEVSDPSFLNGRWHCVGKILGTKSERLPWLGSDPPPDEPEDEPLTATLYLVAGAGASPEEAKRQVMAKIHNVWGSESTPPPGPCILESDAATRNNSRQGSSFVSRFMNMLRRRTG
ncbi:MAG TPA: hypothetical protein PKK83_17560 [Polyangiaceae bacterium]|jgi:hypothetical protein|nr:MAG: hypothetical protein BWY17_03976 [Deltaproteobacteria bacterium ADurb.Bin207]HOD24110.1 hypothetical protein [Polyangiaceae bacterium]HOE50366.1 hypothetical protein [Polyangiaceae bacterium]HOH03190.1 hypothetical protein [Polyangiaceae bacterium]HOR37742.1 hypothetical protein [Polyangiaceae bacterium]